jgi:hypothetical protein
MASRRSIDGETSPLGGPRDAMGTVVAAAPRFAAWTQRAPTHLPLRELEPACDFGGIDVHIMPEVGAISFAGRASPSQISHTTGQSRPLRGGVTVAAQLQG